jgi:hypothetical protein
VLGVSGILESHSLYVAVDTLRRRAAQQGLSLLSYVKTGVCWEQNGCCIQD